jgi:hypothetical protein
MYGKWDIIQWCIQQGSIIIIIITASNMYLNSHWKMSIVNTEIHFKIFSFWRISIWFICPISFVLKHQIWTNLSWLLIIVDWGKNFSITVDCRFIIHWVFNIVPPSNKTYLVYESSTCTIQLYLGVSSDLTFTWHIKDSICNFTFYINVK